jgi:hypothetical protein
MEKKFAAKCNATIFQNSFFLRKKRKRNVIKEELKVIIRKSVQFLLNEFLKEQESNAVN